MVVPTRVVLLTAPGRAAIATLLVAGPRAVESVDGIFQPAGRRTLAELPIGRIVFGRWPSGEASEEVVVCRTREDRVEINCHGGEAAFRAIERTLLAAGCEALDWRGWLRASTTDPLAAEAEIALADAPTERTAMLLIEQRAGALRSAITAIVEHLNRGRADAAITALDALLGWSDLGLHLTKPWRVVLAGRPNVGKSSLINALVGYQRAIVHSAPGTTRDVVTAQTALDGWPVELADTAGLRAAAEPLEAAGIELARQQASQADLLLLVFDRSTKWTAEDEALAVAWPRAVCVFNKCDLPNAAAPARPGIELSALTGAGLDELVRTIVARLVPQTPPPGEAIPFLAEHVARLQTARDALAAGEPDRAREALQAIIAGS